MRFIRGQKVTVFSNRPGSSDSLITYRGTVYREESGSSGMVKVKVTHKSDNGEEGSWARMDETRVKNFWSQQLRPLIDTNDPEYDSSNFWVNKVGAVPFYINSSYHLREALYNGSVPNFSISHRDGMVRSNGNGDDAVVKVFIDAESLGIGR